VPYKKPVAAEIEASLQRIRGFLEAQTPTRVVHKGSGAEVTDFKHAGAGRRRADHRRWTSACRSTKWAWSTPAC
jgi:hypothetical protein